MITERLRAPLAVLAAVVLAAAQAACHDEIPVAPDSPTAAAVANTSADTDPTPTSVQAASVTIQHREQDWALSYGVSEQPRWLPFTHVTYAVASGGAPWDGVSLHLSCTGQRSLSIGNMRPGSDASHATLLVLLDDRPVQAVDVFLRRFPSYSPDGQDERVSFQLDDAAWYERLRSAERLTIRLLDSDQDSITFDLTRLFGTLFQDEIDNCGESSVTAPDR